MNGRFAIIPAGVVAGAIFLPAAVPLPAEDSSHKPGLYPGAPGPLRLMPAHAPGTRRALKHSIQRLEQRLVRIARKQDLDVREKSRRTREAGEVLRSLKLFRALLNTHRGVALEENLHRRFKFLETRGKRGDAHLTGYYDPFMEVRAARDTHFNTPVYGRPRDLIDVNTGLFRTAGKGGGGERLRGRLLGNRLVPYFSRREITRASNFAARRLYYANDVDFHFFQLQGGGLIRDEAGRMTRLGYAADNGRPYRSLYSHLKGKCDFTRAGIKRYLLSRPDLRETVMNANPRFVFFRKVRGGAKGDMGAPLTAGHSVAMDPRLFPRGALVYIKVSDAPGAPARGRFAFVQDSGSAIKGHGRADLYFGSGPNAEQRAWRFNTRGRIFVLVPRRNAGKTTGAMAAPPKQFEPALLR